MKIDIGAKVRTVDGEEIGKVERIVLNSHSKEVDALVVHKGLILTRDVVVPLSMVEGVEGSAVKLRIGRAELAQLPDFLERHYIPASAQHAPTYPYAPGSMLFPLMPGYGVSGVPDIYHPVEEVERIPPEDVDITEGTEVRAVDGPIGLVEQVRTDTVTNRASVLVVRRGHVLGKEVEIPMEFVDEVADDHIKLSLTIKQVEELPIPTEGRYIAQQGRSRKEKKRRP